MLGCLFLTISTCLTMGTGELVKGNSIEQLRERSNKILEVAATEFNPLNFSDLNDYNEKLQSNDIALTMLDTMINLDFVQDDLKSELEILENNYISDNSFKTNFSFNTLKNNSLFNKGQYEDSLILDFANAVKNTTSFNDVIIDDEIIMQSKNIESEDSLLEDIDEELANDIKTNENDNSQDKIPLIANHDNTKMKVNVNEKIDGKTFIGLDFTSDTCISFYNILSNFLNNQATNFISGTSATLYASIVTIIKTTPSAAILQEKIISLFSSIWQPIWHFITSTGSLGLLVVAIILIVLVAVITVIVFIYIAGCNQKGYRVGLIRYGFLNWGIINEIY